MNDPTKVLLFMGAGAGVPLGLPTSTQFVHDVEAGAQPITNHVRTYLGTQADDIEWVLSALEEFKSQTDFTEHLLPHLVGGVANSDVITKQLLKNLATFRRQAAQELVRLKKRIFARLNEFKPEDAVRLHIGLLQWVFRQFEPCAVSVMTTNYDLTFEVAVENAGNELANLGIEDVDYGFSMKFGRPIYDAQRDSGWQQSTLEFLKLHGSLDWHRDSQEQCSRSMSSTVPDDPDQMPILYPGFKGVAAVEPFVSLHGRLNKRLVEADVAVVIGFAFRDAYINALFDNVLRLRSDLRVLYFNPLTLDKHPKESMAPRFHTDYSAFSHTESALALSDPPLTLPDSVSTKLTPKEW